MTSRFPLGSSVEQTSRATQRHWRDYQTTAGRRPVKEFIDALSDSDARHVVAAMGDVKRFGLVSARHVRGDVYEVRADGDRQIFRILFATEGRYGQVLLALEGFSKKSRKMPLQQIELAEQRWQTGGDEVISADTLVMTTHL